MGSRGEPFSQQQLRGIYQQYEKNKLDSRTRELVRLVKSSDQRFRAASKKPENSPQLFHELEAVRRFIKKREHVHDDIIKSALWNNDAIYSAIYHPPKKTLQHDLENIKKHFKLKTNKEALQLIQDHVHRGDDTDMIVRSIHNLPSYAAAPTVKSKSTVGGDKPFSKQQLLGVYRDYYRKEYGGTREKELVRLLRATPQEFAAARAQPPQTNTGTEELYSALEDIRKTIHGKQLGHEQLRDILQKDQTVYQTIFQPKPQFQRALEVIKQELGLQTDRQVLRRINKVVHRGMSKEQIVNAMATLPYYANQN
jgi:alkylhydroperoxidase/carboxymuconolactone decarboxylase family protein YurZ